MEMNQVSINDIVLYEAAVLQSTEEISSLTQTLLHTPNVFSQDALNSCLLHASENWPSILVQALLTAGAHLESRNKSGKTPLLLSVAGNQINITRLLLSKGADVNARDNIGDTALILSTYFSASHNTTKLLLETKNISLELRNQHGYTALACAFEAMNLEAIKLLVDANAHVELHSFGMMNELTCDLPTNVSDVSRRNGILNLVKLFKRHKENGRPAIVQAAKNIDLRSIHYIIIMDNTVLNYDSYIYLRSLIKILKSIFSLPVRDSEMNIVRILTQMYSTLRKEPVDKLHEEKAMELAIYIGDTSIIQLLCKSRFVIPNKFLELIASRGDFNLLEWLVNVNETRIEDQLQYFGSALEEAIHNEHFKCAKLLICYGAFPNLYLELKLAVKSRKEKCLQFLFSEFPEKTTSIVKSSNLLHLSISESDVNISKILLDIGADVNGLNENKIPLMEASDIELIDFLVSMGADVNMVIGDNVNFRLVLHYFLSNTYKDYLKTKVTMKGKDKGRINLHHAALVQRLIYHGSTVDALDSMGKIPLRVASEAEASCEVIKVLFEAGADLNKCGNDGATALQFAVRYRQIENAKCLLELGADTNAGNYTKNSVLFTCDDVDLLKLLLASNANVNAVDSDGNNAIMFHLEKWNSDTTLVAALIDAKCDVNHQNNRGKTPLILAARKLSPELLLELLISGADVNYAITENGKLKSAASIIMKKLGERRSTAADCLQILVTHGLSIKSTPPCIIHALISVGRFSLVSKFISLGFPPIEIVMQRTVTRWYKFKCTISPLVAALLVDNLQAAQLFIDIGFLTRKDLHLLSGNKDAKNLFFSQGQQPCLEFLDKIASQPLSLETLCIVEASELFGSKTERKQNIEKSGLPIPLQEALLHDKMSLELNDHNRTDIFLYKSALRSANICSLTESYDEMMHQYDDDFDSDSY